MHNIRISTSPSVGGWVSGWTHRAGGQAGDPHRTRSCMQSIRSPPHTARRPLESLCREREAGDRSGWDVGRCRDIAHITNAKVWAEGTFESGRVLVLTAPMYPMLNESPFHMYVLCAEAKPIVAAAMKALSMLAKWTWEVVWFWGGCCRCKQRTFPKHCNF
jgi:hypothetical protein